MDGLRLPNKKGRFTPNPLRIENGVAYIGMTDRFGRIVAEARVSEADAASVIAAGRWHLSYRSHTNYVGCSHRVNGKMRHEWLHHFLMGRSDLDIDHIDGDGTNNQRENLRLVTTRENMQNRHTGFGWGRSGVRNVHWEAKSGRWKVELRVNGRMKWFGSFATVEEAAVVAEQKRREFYIGPH